MVRREIRGRYLVAFLLTSSVFVLGIFLGVLMSDVKISKIYGYERELMVNLLLQDVNSELIQSSPCEFVDSGLVSQELFKVGDRLDALERELGKNDEEVLSLKRYYTVLEVKDYLFFSKLNEKCGGKFVLNLFFYSNDPKKCERCDDQGFVLSYVRGEDNRIRTYSFDVDLGVPVVNYFIDLYNITDVPVVVFDDKVYYGFLGREEIDSIIKNVNNK